MSIEEEQEIFYAIVVDAKTGETITRPFNNEELDDYKATQLASVQAQESLDAAAAVRISALTKLKKLGLTQEEIESL